MSVIESPMEDLAGNTQKSQNLNRKLPLSRVKKIVKMDEDVIAISNAAAQIISASTERFAAYFAEQSFFFTLAEKKKGLSYKHCASAVARLPQLDFLADVVPPISKNNQSTNMQNKKSTSKTKNGPENNDSEIPEWARAHPEALAKIQAAQAAHALREQETRKENDSIVEHIDEPAAGDQNDTSEGQPIEQEPTGEDAKQQNLAENSLVETLQNPLSQRQPRDPSIEPDEEMDDA